MTSLRHRLPLLCLLLAPLAGAQAVELSVGASSIYNAAGGTLLLHGPRSETTLGVGFTGHQLTAGGSLERQIPRGTETLGLSTIRADVPTDIFNQTHQISGVGAALSLHGLGGSPNRDPNRDPSRDAGRELHAFAGFASLDGGSPFLRSGSLEQAAAFFQWSRPLAARCRVTTTALHVQSTLALQSINCTVPGHPAAQFAVTAGGGSLGPYAAASYILQTRTLDLRLAWLAAPSNFRRGTDLLEPIPEPTRGNAAADLHLSRSWTLSAAQQHFHVPAFSQSGTQSRTQPGTSSPAEDTDLQQLGLRFHHGATTAAASLLRSSVTATATPPAHNQSATLYLEQTTGRLQLSCNLLRSRSALPSIAPQTTQTAVAAAALRLNPHLLVSEQVSLSGGQLSSAPGGQLVTRFGSLRVNYDLLYLPTRPAHPFQQTMLVNAALRLWHAVAAEFSTDVSPLGRPGYTARLTTYRATAAAADVAPGTGARLGTYVIAGQVLDDRGSPVPGAALLIGSTHLYTDQTGCFLLRESHSARHLLALLPEEFLEPGDFHLLVGPATVTSTPESSSIPVRLIIGRQPTPAHAAAQETRL